MERLEQPEQQEPMERPAQLEQQEQMEQRVRPEQREPMARLARPAQLELRVRERLFHSHQGFRLLLRQSPEGLQEFQLLLVLEAVCRGLQIWAQP